MGCSAERNLYKVYLVIDGNCETGHKVISEMLANDSKTRIMNLDSNSFSSPDSPELESNENYKHLKSDIQNRGILFALFVQHDFDGLIIVHDGGDIEKYEELLDVAQIQWEEEISKKSCILIEEENSTSLFPILIEKYPQFNFEKK